MKKSIALIALTIIVTALLTSCKQEEDKTVFDTYAAYANIKAGKFIIYQLDSTVTINFGASFTKKSYLVKDTFITTFYDNLNRLSYKINRYQFDNASNTWINNNTFYITPTTTSIEYVENNIRYISLVNPVSVNNVQWQGNIYAAASPYYVNSNFTTWSFTYKNIKQPFTIGSTIYPNTITVVQQDSTTNNTNATSTGAANTALYAAFNKSYEVYADSVGLIYKDVLSWEYEPPYSSINVGYTGYGVRLSIISHN